MSGRSSTYRIRMWMGWALVIPALMTTFTRFGSTFRADALGSNLADLQFVLLMVAVYAILPAITAEAIAGEKENRSLSLLMITDLSPTELVLQKYFSRLIPMATLLLLSAPVFAVAYAYGGITAGSVCAMLLILSFTAMQVGAIAILCSALCRSTTGAIVATYAMGVAVYFGPHLLALLDQSTLRLWTAFDSTAFARTYASDTTLAWVPFHRFAGCRNSAWDAIAASLPVMLTTVIFLILARQALLRALTESTPAIERRFRKMDVLFARLNALLGNRVFGGLAGNLPAYAPVEWREKHRLGMAKRNHLVRLVLMIEIPVLVLMIILAQLNASGVVWVWLVATTWLVCGLVVLIQSTLAFPIERTNQTIDILFSTPLDSGEIAEQKYAALKRLLCILMIPCVTVISSSFLSADFLFFGPTFAWYFLSMRSLMLIGLRSGASTSNRISAFASTIARGAGIAVLWAGSVAVFFTSIKGVIFGLPILLLALKTGRDRYLSQITEQLEDQRDSEHAFSHESTVAPA